MVGCSTSCSIIFSSHSIDARTGHTVECASVVSISRLQFLWLRIGHNVGTRNVNHIKIALTPQSAPLRPLLGKSLHSAQVSTFCGWCHSEWANWGVTKHVWADLAAKYDEILRVWKHYVIYRALSSHMPYPMVDPQWQRICYPH